MLKLLVAATLLMGSLALFENMMPSRPGMRRMLGAIRTPAATIVARLGGEAADLGIDEDGEVNFVRKTDDEWKAELSEEKYKVLRCSSTERPFTGEYYEHDEKGTYLCGGCGQELFSSETKYKSGSGWPSYYQPISDEAVVEIKDISYGMVRTEIVCSRCESHLGHVFPDGPRPTGLRYCINSAALDFRGSDGSAAAEAAQ